MGEHTKYQMEYIESVDGCAHQSAVDIIGALEQQCDELATALQIAMDIMVTEIDEFEFPSSFETIHTALAKYRQPQEEAPELFPGTLEALDRLGKQK